MARYLVEFARGRDEEVYRGLKSLGLTPIKKTLKYWVVDAPPDLAPKIESLPGVVRVVRERTYSISSIPVELKLSRFIEMGGPMNPAAMIWAASFRKDRWPTSESRKVLEADIADKMGITGKGVKVAVLDTGFDSTIQKPAVDYMDSTLEGDPAPIDLNGHGCIEPNAMIYTTLCGLTTIKEFYERVNSEEVWINGGWVKILKEPIWTIGRVNGETQPVRVLAVHKIPFKGKAVRVKARTCEFITSTWHPFLVRDLRYDREWYIEAERLYTENSYRRLVIPEKPVELFHQKTVPEDLAYLAGLFIAEGTLAKYEVQYALHEREAPIILEYLQKLGYNAKVCREKRHMRGKRVLVYGKLYYELAKLFKGVEKEKYIPEALLKQPLNVIVALIAGIIDGDGHFDKNKNRLRIVTTSEKLARQLVNMFYILGMDARITCRQPSRTKDKKPMFQVSVINGNWELFKPYLKLKAPQWLESRHKYRDLRVHSVELIDYDGYMYDLTTESGNYLAGKQGMTFIHNTHVLTTIAGGRMPTPWGWLEGVARRVQIASIKCLGYGIGTARTSDVIEAIASAYNYGAKIVNMSLGSNIKPGEKHDPETCPLCSLITALSGRGVIFSIAAGNSGRGYASCPGTSPGAVTVAALRKDLSVADFTSREHPVYIELRKPDLGAPGVDIGSSSTGLIATMEWIDLVPRTAFISGTSMSTPHVSGLLALWVEYARRKGVELTRDMVMDIVGHYSRGWSPETGYSVPRFSWIVDYLR
ncbi:MAG: S8 family serine peptidase [Thermoproteota archaeon]